jgi:hypothetical protein
MDTHPPPRFCILAQKNSGIPAKEKERKKRK